MRISPEDAIQYLTSNGLQPHHAAGILGNFDQESSLDTEAVNPQSGAFGLGQWLGPRKTALLDYADQAGRDARDPYTQMDFMLSELSGPERRAMVALQDSRTPEDAALAFSHRYERAGKHERNDSRRTSRARQILDHAMSTLGIKALNALVPAVNAAESDWTEVDDGPQSAGGEGDWTEIDEPPADLYRSIRSGVGLNLEEKLISARETADDLSRWAHGRGGKPYSAEREALQAEGNRIESDIRRLGPAGKAGYYATDMIAIGAVPVPGLLPARLAANGGLGGMLGALKHYESPEARSHGVVMGMATGAVAPEVIPPALSVTGGMIGRTGSAARSMVDPRYGALREARRVIEQAGHDLPLSITVGGGGNGGHGGSGGGSAGRWDLLGPEFQPTVGMMVDASQQPEILALEHTGRNRESPIFYQRDVNNKRVLQEGIRERGLDRIAKSREMAALDEATGQLRDDAFAEIRNSGDRDAMLGPLAAEINRLRGEAGSRVDPGTQTIVDFVDGQLAKVGDMADPADLYTIRKAIIDRLKGKGKPNDDPLANAVKSNRRTVMQIRSAIDQGLTQASGGKWLDYLDAYRTGIKPIESGRAVSRVLESFDTAPPLAGNADYRDITPGAMRRAIANQTYQEMGPELQDLLLPEHRAYLSQVEDAMNALELAQKGTQSVTGSPTGGRIWDMVKSLAPVNVAEGVAGKAMTGVKMMEALARLRGAYELDRLMLNPDEFNAILAERAAGNQGGLSGMLSDALRSPPGQMIASTATNVGRRLARRPKKR